MPKPVRDTAMNGPKRIPGQATRWHTLLLGSLVLAAGVFSAGAGASNQMLSPVVSSSQAIYVPANAPIAFTKQVIATGVKKTHVALGADLDGDADIDVVATDYENHKVYWYQNDGSGQFAQKVLDGNLTGAYPAYLADVDQDGDTDVMAAGYLADTFVWYRNEGGGVFTRLVIDNAADGAHSIVTTDLDGDGDIDFVTSSQDAATIAWYENDGATNFTRHIIDTTSLKAKRAEVADLDGDGDLDIATASFQNDQIAWHKNDGNENFSKHIIDHTADGGYYVSLADADGDGDVDVFAASQLDHTIALYVNDGLGSFTFRLIDYNALRARTVFAADMDRDGDMDALAASVVDDTVAWHENDGSGQFVKHVIDNTANGAYNVFAVDMDLDGDLDVLSASKNSHQVAIHWQSQTPAPTPTHTPDPGSTPTGTPDPTATPADTPTPTQTLSAGLIFLDGFESGDLSAWSSSVTDAGDLSVTSAAAIVGTKGLQAVIDSNGAIYVKDLTPASESRYRARFYFDLNSMPMISGNTQHIFVGRSGTVDVLRIQFRYSSGKYQVRAQIRTDGTGYVNTTWKDISDAAHFIEIDWKASSAAGANDGTISLWVDGVLKQTKLAIDNDTRRVDEVRLGATGGIDTGTRGTYYFDQFESRRTTYIGP